MDSIEPAKADDLRKLRWRRMPRFIGLSRQKAERRPEGSEFRGGDKSQIDLQSACEEKHPVYPGARLHVNMMYGRMPIVHALSPIGDDTRQFGSIDNAKSKINVRPPVFTFRRGRPSDRDTTDSTVMGGEFKNVGSQLSTFFWRKH